VSESSQDADATTIADLKAEVARLRGALRTAEEELSAQRAAVRELTVRDELTGLFNQNELRRLLNEEVSRALRYKHPLSLLLVDIDGLDGINAEHGKRAGDDVLRSVAAVLRGHLRPVDRSGRHEGAALAVLLPDTFASDGVQVAERLRALVGGAASRAASAAPNRPKVTISVGVAGIHESEKTPDDLLHAASTALREAKDRGRDAVVAFVDLPSSRA
jgi:two-component system, cell cycle response regulator